MQLLPAICEQNCQLFGNAITRIQAMIGTYFAPVQGGIYRSSAVERTIHLLEEYGAQGSGQSSWGPTGFAIFANETDAYHALKQVRKHREDNDRTELLICRARNRKAEVTVEKSVIGKIRKQ